MVNIPCSWRVVAGSEPGTRRVAAAAVRSGQKLRIRRIVASMIKVELFSCGNDLVSLHFYKYKLILNNYKQHTSLFTAFAQS